MRLGRDRAGIGKWSSASKLGPEGGWPYLAGALAFAGLETIFTFWTGRTIGITSHLLGLPVWFPRLGVLRAAGILLVGGIVYGAALGAARGREWRLRLPRRWREALFAGLGGLLMGIGARLAPGCNVGGVVGGIASSSLQGWVEGIFLIVGVAVGLVLAIRICYPAK